MDLTKSVEYLLTIELSWLDMSGEPEAPSPDCFLDSMAPMAKEWVSVAIHRRRVDFCLSRDVKILFIPSRRARSMNPIQNRLVPRNW